ncbi:MAG: ATP synthase subunit I [Acidimicrobiia bacterium]|nr:ATP synthase subunit I [Acidimicrobiia bacterium]
MLSAPRVDGPAPETQLAKDMVRRSLPFLPLLVLLGTIIGGVDGAVSAFYAVVIVLANFALSAALLAWAARISLGLLMGVALFGFLLRLGLIFLAVLAFADASWMNLWALGVVLIVTHLGLLFWEMRFVSISLAHPGLRPPTRRTAVASGARRPS